MGGKKALREEIVARFPQGFERYVEVFGGGGWVTTLIEYLSITNGKLYYYNTPIAFVGAYDKILIADTTFKTNELDSHLQEEWNVRWVENIFPELASPDKEKIPPIKSVRIWFFQDNVDSRYKFIPYQTFSGFGKGENRYTYPVPTLTQCEELLTKCSGMADYLLVDISSNLALLTDHGKFSAEKQIRVLNDIHDMSWDISKQKKNYELLLPHCQELGEQSRLGNLLNTLMDNLSGWHQQSCFMA